MKNLFKTLSFLGLSLSLSVSAQTGSKKAKSQADLQSAPQNEAKTAYISNQGYLTPSSTTGYNTYYGDSLGGFDEVNIKKSILAKNLPGWEAQIYLHRLKREFINKKYSIGPQPNYLPAIVKSPTGGGKTIGGGANVNVLPCVNEDFEATSPGAYTTGTAVTGWTITSRTNDSNCSPTNWNAGSNEFWIVQTPILSWGSVGSIMGVIPNSPLGGSNVAQLGDHTNNTYMTRIAQQFPVTSANTLFQFAYAGYWQDGGGGHSCCPTSNDQPGIDLKMYDCAGVPLSCSALSLSPGSGCQSTGVTFTLNGSIASWTNWQVKYIDLTPYVGSCVTIEIITKDCAFGGHWGSTLFDTRCGGQLIGSGLGGSGGSIGGPVSFCAGSNVAIISAPVGYSTYQWFAPGTGSIAAPQGTMAALTVSNPIPGSVYTVQLVAPSGCIFTSTNAISFSTITIAGVGTTSTCAGGASGSATVVGNGSGSGYNYTWISATSGATLGTAATISSLAPGTYSVILTALGAAGCGSAVTTVTISTGPPGIISYLKPFCNNEAYLGPASGSGFQWYNGSTPIPAPFGTAPGYTVTSPVNFAVYWLSHLSAQGCQDSVQYTLIASQPGLMQVTDISKICPGGNNGTATINLSPAPGAPGGLNSYSIVSTGTTAAYSSSLFPTFANTYTFGGLSAGVYSVNVFDGSCKYSTTFNLNPHVFTFSITPSTATLCAGSSVNAAVSFTSPPTLSQYSYSWSPSTFLFGPTNQNVIATPVFPPGTNTTIVYTVVVTPSIVNCPVSKTVAITAINPPIPTFTPIPNMCNTFAPYQILANPAGGVFSSPITGTNNPLTPNGIITPSLAMLSGSQHTFTYTITQYTCTAKASANFQVSQFWTAQLSSTVPPLCVTSPQFNLMNIVQNTQYGTWSGSTPGTVGGGQFNPGAPGLTTGIYQVTYKTTSQPNGTVCPDVATTTVSVTKTITPNISPVMELCSNGALVNMTVSPGGGGWLPNVAISNQGVINPALIPVPSTVGTYTVMQGPCLNSNTIAVNVSRFYTAALSGPIPPLCFNSQPFNLMSVVQNTTNGTWSILGGGPAATAVQSNSFFPSGIPTNVYVLEYNTISSPNPNLCKDTKTISVSLLNPTTPTITQIGPFCDNGTAIQLGVSSPDGGHWSTSPYVSASGLFSPPLSSVGNNVVQYVVGTNTCNVQDTKYISIEAFVPADIVSKLPDLCNTSPILNLGPLTLSGLGVWSGPGISGTNFNPGNTGSGQFTLMHSTASSPSGLCPDQALVSVNVYSLASPIVTQAGPFCNSSMPVQLQVTPVGGMFGGPSVGAINLAGKFNPASAIIGDNVVNYSITSGPCQAYTQTVIKVERLISADFNGYAGPFCKTNEPVNMDHFAQNPGGEWYTKDNTPGLLGNMFHPSLAGITNMVIHRTESQTKGLCTHTAAIQIEVRELPVVSAISNTPGGCVPVEVGFSTQGRNSGESVWSINDGSEILTGLSVNHIFTVPGTYEIQLNYTDDIGCKALPVKTQQVVAHEVPKADFSFPDEIYINEPQIQLTNQTTVLSNNTYQWKIGGSATLPTDVNPVVNLSKIGKYQVTLIATSIYGCKDEVTKTLEVKNIFNVFIPNSFSPNFDGLNDYFMPVFSKEGLDLKTFEMEIFDRWGHSLFHSKDATAKGWDGSVQNKGEPLKEEVYIYRIKYRDLEGNAYNKMGHVSLVK